MTLRQRAALYTTGTGSVSYTHLIIAEIPSAEELAALCEKIGAFYKPEQIGIDPALSEDMLSVSAAIRNRLTLIRMRRVLDFGE